jgi:hypothetical protein
MAGDVDFIRAGIIMLGVILVSYVILAALGPIADELDYRLYLTNTSDFPVATSTVHAFHDWLYYAVIIINVLNVIWFVKLLVTNVGANRQTGQW